MVIHIYLLKKTGNLGQNIMSKESWKQCRRRSKKEEVLSEKESAPDTKTEKMIILGSACNLN